MAPAMPPTIRRRNVSGISGFVSSCLLVMKKLPYGVILNGALRIYGGSAIGYVSAPVC
jgi:hypothetical protein